MVYQFIWVLSLPPLILLVHKITENLDWQRNLYISSWQHPVFVGYDWAEINIRWTNKKSHEKIKCLLFNLKYLRAIWIVLYIWKFSIKPCLNHKSAMALLDEVALAKTTWSHWRQFKSGSWNWFTENHLSFRALSYLS